MMDNMTQLISWFQLEYPELVSDMKNSNHHLSNGEDALTFDKVRYNGNFDSPYNINPYHCESDVFTHTMMVCKQAENAPYLVKLAALLHDIGKPATRKVNPKNGRVSFFNHDAVGAFMALEILKRGELGLTKNQISHVFNLIALHTQIYKLTNEQLSSIGDESLVEDLIHLGRADHSGRFHTEGSAEIPDFLDISFGRNYQEERKTDKEVIVLCGLPASGKSSWFWVQYVNTDKNFSVISRDAFIEASPGLTYSEKWNNTDQKNVDKLLQERFNDVKKYPTVNTVVDMTHMSKKSRRKSLSHFDSSYKKKCVVFLTDLQTLELRNSQRTGKVIDKEVIEKMMRSFYPPTFEEFDEIEYVIGD